MFETRFTSLHEFTLIPLDNLTSQYTQTLPEFTITTNNAVNVRLLKKADGENVLSEGICDLIWKYMQGNTSGIMIY